jgi:hypothetical protein
VTAPGWAEDAWRAADRIGEDAYVEAVQAGAVTADDAHKVGITAAATELSRLCVSREEFDRVVDELRKAKQASWFYHPDHTEYCQYSPHEVVDDYYDPEPGKHVFEIECARPLPSIWCAVHCLTEDEQETMGTDERFVLTEHPTEEEARQALEASNGQ